MISPQEQAEQVQYRLALIPPLSRALLAERVDGVSHLPRVSIPRWTRPAEQINLVLKQKWNVRTIVLDVLSGVDDAPPCALIEVRSPLWPFVEDGLVPVSIDDLSPQDLSGEECHRVREILPDEAGKANPFARLGWAEEAQQWIRESVSDHIVEFTDDILQLNANGTFALIRFGTKQGPAYWLKATGIPNRHECVITVALARMFPQWLPPLVAAREDWNAWVTEDAGPCLRESFSEAGCRQAVLSLAELQYASVEHTDALLKAGCGDNSIAAIEAHVDVMVEYLEEAMEQQTSTRVPRLSVRRLREIRNLLHDACSEMLGLGIPDTLVHNDINPGNVLLHGQHCVFTDWAEAGVGNPFLTFEHLSVHIGRYGEEARSWQAQLQSLYKECWLTELSESQIVTAFWLSPILAIAMHLYGRGTWLHSPDLRSSASHSYRRSLARHMDRAAQALEEARTAW